MNDYRDNPRASSDGDQPRRRIAGADGESRRYGERQPRPRRYPASEEQAASQRTDTRRVRVDYSDDDVLGTTQPRSRASQRPVTRSAQQPAAQRSAQHPTRRSTQHAPQRSAQRTTAPTGRTTTRSAQRSTSAAAEYGTQRAPQRSTQRTAGRAATSTRRAAAPTSPQLTTYQRSAGGYRPAQPGRSRTLPPWLALVALVVLIAAVVAIGCAVMNNSSSASGTDRTNLVAGDKSADASATASQKAGNETTDANGIVHGTTDDGVNYLVFGAGQKSKDGSTISLAAVGDVFATSMNFGILDAYAGEVGDGLYDFEPYYQGTRDTISGYDLRFINQETPCAGDENGYSYSGYPVFNTPDSSITALANVGFNIANYNSNHSWDQGTYGIERTQSLFAKYPGIALIGSYASQEDRDTLRMVERNGARIALLSYCFMDNFYGTDPASFPNTYYSCPFDRDVMRTEIERAKTIADAVVVYVHWGTEYTAQPDDFQLEYAQFLADLDVDLVLGSHAHILQPVKYYTGPSGKQIPVVFGLSDFITGWTITDTILSGMYTCDFAWHGDKLTVENSQFYPAIEWQSENGGDTYVRFLKDMSEYEIATNLRTEDVGDDVSYLHSFIDDLGMDVPVVW